MILIKSLTEDERIQKLRERVKKEEVRRLRDYKSAKGHKPKTNETKYPKLSYEHYLKTKWWKARRKQALKNAGFQCQKCAERHGLEVHHLHYNRLWREKQADLIVLCQWHHLNEHPKYCEGNNLPEELRPPKF